MVWLKARANFTHKGRALAIDDVFSVENAIEAVQLKASRLVELARRPVAPTHTFSKTESAPLPPDVSPSITTPYRRPRGRPRKVTQEQTDPEPANVASNWESSVNWPGPTDDAA